MGLRRCSQVIVSVLLMAGICFSLFASTREEIEQRIKPIGSVRLAPDKPKLSIEKTAPALDSPVMQAEGKAVYQKHCIACHGTGLAGAPRFRVSQDWQARMKQGINTLIEIAKKRCQRNAAQRDLYAV